MDRHAHAAHRSNAWIVSARLGGCLQGKHEARRSVLAKFVDTAVASEDLHHHVFFKYSPPLLRVVQFICQVKKNVGYKTSKKSPVGRALLACGNLEVGTDHKIAV